MLLWCMERNIRSGGRRRGGDYSHRLAPGESRTQKKSASNETAEEVVEEAGACQRCDTPLSPEDVYIVVDNALWEFYPVGNCSECGLQFEPGFGWRD